MGEKNILMLFYANPDFYPPVINMIRLLSGEYKVKVLCRNIKQSEVKYPDSTGLMRFGKIIESDQQAAGQSVIQKLIQFGSFVFRAAAVSFSSKPEVIISYDMHGFAAGLLARAVNPRSRLIYQCHDLTESSHCSSFMKWIKRIELRFARSCDMVVFPNLNRARLFQKQARLKSLPLVVANANLQRQHIDKGNLAACLKSKGFPADEPVVLHQGIICRNQQSLNVLRSILFWRKGICVMIGAIETGIQKEIEMLVKELGIEKRVVFIGHVPYDRLSSYTADAAIGLALTRPANINLEYYAEAACKINDYIACGVPVITSNNNDCRQIYGNAEWITYVDGEDPESIAAAVNHWLSDSSALQRAGREARKLHLEKYNYEKCTEKIRGFIDEAVNS